MPNVEAMEQLKRVVREAPDEGWAMGIVEGRGKFGTVRCAVGWARQDPWFLENTNIGLHRSADLADEWAPSALGVSPSDVEVLFAFDNSAGRRQAEGNPVTKDEVIANIDRLIADRPPIPYADVEDDGIYEWANIEGDDE